MAQSAYPSFLNPVPVIDPEFCSPHPVDLVMVESRGFTKTLFNVTDSNGSLMFKVKTSPLSHHSTLMIVDSAGKPIVNLRRKIFTMRSRWQVFRGESSDIKDLVFKAKSSSLFQMRTNLDIFLPNNNSEEKVCDFKVKDRGGWISRSFDVYAGDTTIIAAQMDEKLKFFEKNKLMVKVQQNIDYAFIVALATIFEDISKASNTNSNTSA